MNELVFLQQTFSWMFWAPLVKDDVFLVPPSNTVSSLHGKTLIADISLSTEVPTPCLSPVTSPSDLLYNSEPLFDGFLLMEHSFDDKDQGESLPLIVPKEEKVFSIEPSKTMLQQDNQLSRKRRAESNSLSKKRVKSSNMTLFENLTASGIDWCRYCGTTEGVNWRPGPWGKRTLCNKHGCDYKGYGLASRLPRLDLSDFVNESLKDRRRPVVQQYCIVCQSPGLLPENELIPCQGGCSRAYHQRCHSDAIDSNDSWYCKPQCRQNKEHKQVALFAFVGTVYAGGEGSLVLPIWNHPLDMHPGGPVPQATACASAGQIALTYNEGPSDVTAKVLNGLKAAQAKANFFVNATWLYTQQYAMILQRAYNDGHLIGMSYRIPGDTSEGLTDDQIKQDVTDNAKIIETLIGVAPKYVRLHYTFPEDTRLQNILRNMGYTLIGYNLDAADYNYKNDPEGISNLYRQIFEKQLETYDSKGSFISLQYDIPETGSWQAIYDVVRVINDSGYTMVRLDGCLNDMQPYKEKASSVRFISDKHSLGQPSYKSGQVAPEKPTSVGSQFRMAGHDTPKEDTEVIKMIALGSVVSVSSWSHFIVGMIALFCIWVF
ncbi:hypothetical protein A0J61_06098 [Choanephora cucurbitarum]|uniref:NodB homology domain-containing protein n=1 Tax=Choanephora cucurbitarum TaxID=101091 RepID=A0A1C7N9P5_9FUNG|nr:hypothetical protein A0J61_06098 [Choanephora cucurbitarum]